MPTEKPTLIQNVYDKLTKLSEGKTYTPTPEEVKETEAAAAVAQKTSDEIAKSHPNVEKVDAVAEAEKEKAAS
jgi:hypothetical protein